MNPLSQSVRDLLKHSLVVAGYSLATITVAGAYRLVDEFLRATVTPENPPAWLPVATLLLSLYLAAAAASVQSVAFAYLGKLIDHPIWKCAGWREALRRFFKLWFLINLALILLISLLGSAAEREWLDAMAMTEFCLVFCQVFSIPVGACVMFWGKFDWLKVGEILEPLYRRYYWTLWVLLLCLVQWMMMVARAEMIEEKGIALVIILSLTDIPLCVIDCLAFIMMWRICVEHRNRAFQEDDNPYD